MPRSSTNRVLAPIAALCLSFAVAHSAYAVIAAPNTCTSNADCSSGTQCYQYTRDGSSSGTYCTTSEERQDWVGSGGSLSAVGGSSSSGSPTVPGQTTGTNPSGSPTVPGQTTGTNPGTGSGSTGGDCASGTSDNCLKNPLKYTSLEGLLQGVLKSLVQVGGILLTLALVWVGFKFVAARGNEEKIRSARTALMYTIIGGLILLGATAIESVISATVGSITA